MAAKPPAPRDAIEAALRSVAERCLRKRSWRSFWWVDIDGCRFKFQISGYAKAHTPIWDEQQAELKAEVVGRLPFQSRARIYQELCADGYLEPMEKHYGGTPFPVTVRGYQLTHAGRFAYCSSCGETEMEDRDF